MAIIKLNGYVIGTEKVNVERIKELEKAGFTVVIK